jgi:hypothetical protein
VNGELNYLRGAFIAYEPGGYPQHRRVIPFRFNPESLSRQLSIESGQTGGGAEGARPASRPDASAEQSADAASGPLKESFTVQIRLDLADRAQVASDLPEELGIAPEIAALEDLLHPAESQSEAASDGTEPVRPRRARPAVLLVWGRKRVLPVRITSLTINESVFNSSLNPVRAEIDAGLEVMGETDARDNPAVRSALDFTNGNRRELAGRYYANTADQGSNILPL